MKSFLFLCLFLSSTVAAFAVDPTIQMDLQLSAYWRPDPVSGTSYTPTVHSYANAAIYDRVTGQRIYRQIILDHGVADNNLGRFIFTARLVSENGYMSSTTRDLPGAANHCYTATAVAHANDFNLHVREPNRSTCMPPYPEKPEKPEIPEENSPILLDLNLDGFHLSGPNPPVSFDINADGAPDQIAWTRAAGDDVFLCLDRNQNGTIDDGTELFGYATPLLSGKKARIGYKALADLDRPELGGNGDGRIDRGDVLFQSLCVWNDWDRNGQSESSELRSAEEAGVVSLDYDYRITKIQDMFGNLFRYASQAEIRTRADRTRSWPTFDVIFVGAAL